MLDIAKDLLKPPARLEEVMRELEARYKDYQDPWGFKLESAARSVKIFWPLYEHYFRVKVHGAHHVENKPYMVVSNHSGQIAIDGVLISLAFALDVTPPRLLRGMVERFLAGLPFLGDFVAQSGSILGDRKNCQYLLERGESILVFPEGVRGISKSTQDFYKLQSFTKGFYRIALQSRTEILPICVIGAEEFYPHVVHLKKVAKFFNLPALPITPFFPWFGPLGLIPMPSPVDIYIGKPIPIPDGLSMEASDKEIAEHVYKIESEIKALMDHGLKNKREMVSLDKEQVKMYANLLKETVKQYGKL